MSVVDFEATFVEVRFPDRAENFLKVKETLTRIGAPSYPRGLQSDTTTPVTGKILWQSCHILHKRGKFYIVHFKEMFLLDGKSARTNLTVEDLARRNAIALLLADWGLVEIVHPARVRTPPPAPIDTIKVIAYKEKSDWTLSAKYEIGKKTSHLNTRHGEQ